MSDCSSCGGCDSKPSITGLVVTGRQLADGLAVWRDGCLDHIPFALVEGLPSGNFLVQIPELV